MAKTQGWRSLLTPGNALQALAVFVVGSLIGVGGYTFVFANGLSYLGSDPATCANCHVMQNHYDAWMAGSHAGVAGCNDCHAPHDSMIHKYIVKGENGLQHGLKFTTGRYPDNIEMRQVSRDITNTACLYCHAEVTNDIRMATGEAQMNCTKCHVHVGHKTR